MLAMALATTHLGKLDSMPTITAASIKEINCLAQNIYHEARSEPLNGQIAVAQVTINRVKLANFKKTICEVVFAPHQFSWTSNKRLRVRDVKAWRDSLAVAKAVLTNSTRFPNFTATHYHTKQVNPRWNRNMEILAVIGSHIFYA